MKQIFIIFKKIWNFIDSLKPHTKTGIIVGFCIIFVIILTRISNINVLSDYINQIEKNEKKADKYTMDSAARIYECVHTLQINDPDCFNVLLLNYHNSQKSLQGLRYIYLNCIVESPKNLEDDFLKHYWSDLEYFYYYEELSRIHNYGYLRIENVDSIATLFPRLHKKLLTCGAKSAAFYPIEGIDGPIGMVLVLYKNPKKYNIGFYTKYVSPQIQKLSILLDY